MRRILAVATLVVFSTISANAATITGKLVDLSAANTAPGSIHTIQIQLMSTGTGNGIAQAEMEITSTGTNNGNFGTQAGATAANTTTFAAAFGADGYGTVKPSLGTDGSGDTSLWNPKPVLGASTDGDFDAVGIAFFATPGGVDSDPGDGAAFGLSNGFEIVGTTKWVFNATDTLNLYIASPAYFADAGGGATVANPAYDVVAATGVVVTIVPEPASMVLLGLGGLGLAYAARRRS